MAAPPMSAIFAPSFVIWRQVIYNQPNRKWACTLHYIFLVVMDVQICQSLSRFRKNLKNDIGDGDSDEHDRDGNGNDDDKHLNLLLGLDHPLPRGRDADVDQPAVRQGSFQFPVNFTLHDFPLFFLPKIVNFMHCTPCFSFSIKCSEIRIQIVPGTK